MAGEWLDQAIVTFGIIQVNTQTLEENDYSTHLTTSRLLRVSAADRPPAAMRAAAAPSSLTWVDHRCRHVPRVAVA
jgi:hypothetical protein